MIHTNITHDIINYIGNYLISTYSYVVDKAEGFDYDLHFLFDNDSELFFGGIDASELKEDLKSAFQIDITGFEDVNTNIKRWYDGMDIIITWSDQFPCELCGKHGWIGCMDISVDLFEWLYEMYVNESQTK